MFIFNFFKRSIPAEKFEKCALALIRHYVTGKEAVRDDLDAIDRLHSDLPAANREKACAYLYLKLENYISREQPKNRVPREILREKILNKCGAERAEGNFALLFVQSHLRKIRLFERFAESILDKVRFLDENLYAKILPSIEEDEYLQAVFKENKPNWLILEQRIRKHQLVAEEQEMFTAIPLKNALQIIFKSLTPTMGATRAELIFRDTYNEFRDKLMFLEDVPQVLFIMPEGLLQEERVQIMPKAQLEEVVRRRTDELERALAELREEKGKLAAALERLKKTDLAKSDFIVVVSHQFRTPLSAIRWNAEVLEDKISALVAEKHIEGRVGELLEFTKSIEERSVFLSHILSDIYDVLAVEGGTMTMEKSPAQLWEIVSDVLRSFEKQAKEKGVAIIFDRSSVPLKEIVLDQRKIARVCEIIVRNAVQYTSSGGTATIVITEAEYNGAPALSCSIRDSGIGIAAEDLPKLFTKFFRAKNAMNMVPDGAGLGLYLVKHFVEAHGGAVKVQSGLNKGSEFIFTLPLISPVSKPL